MGVWGDQLQNVVAQVFTDSLTCPPTSTHQSLTYLTYLTPLSHLSPPQVPNEVPPEHQQLEAVQDLLAAAAGGAAVQVVRAIAGGLRGDYNL